MKVTIIRHGKVKHIWKKSCSSDEFDEECRLYDTAPIEEMARVATNEVPTIYVSILDRSTQTAKMLYGERDFFKSELIHEVPMKAAFDTKLKLPIWVWYFLGRIQWMTDNKRQPETRKQTVERAERFTKDIIEKNEDCVLISHGFFMHTLISVMKRKGFNSDRTSAFYKNGEAIVMIL